MTALDPSERDRLIVSILCLTPCERACLDKVQWLDRPVQSHEIAHLVSRLTGSIKRDFGKLQLLGLLIGRGSGRKRFYVVLDEVAILLQRFRSIATPRTKMDRQMGLAILTAARESIDHNRKPGGKAIAAMTGFSESGVRLWIKRLVESGALSISNMKFVRDDSVYAWLERTTV